MSFEKTIDMIYVSLNRVRMQPASEAAYYQNSQRLQNVKTREGLSALQSLTSQLKQRSSVPNKLKWSFALHMVADQQAIKLGDNSLTTTQGTCYNKALPQRVQQYCMIRGRISQVYQFGSNSPQQVMQSLLIDDGLASRKRRKTMLDPIYNYVGIATSFHQKYGTVTVIILAEDVISLVTPGDQGNYFRRDTIPQGKVYQFNIQQQKTNILKTILEEASRKTLNDSFSSKKSNPGYENINQSVYNAVNNSQPPVNPVNHQNALLSQTQPARNDGSCQIF